MNYFDGLIFEKGTVTVLGADDNSDFVKALAEFLKTSGNVAIALNEADTDSDYIIYLPDRNTDGRFVMHTQQQLEFFRQSRYIIGVVDVGVFEKRISEAVVGAEDFAEYTGLAVDELIYPYALAKVIQDRENFDLLYIDNVDSESKRYLARDLAKRHKNGTCIRMINTDHRYVERLTEPQSNI